MKRFLQPKSVAIIGISRRSGPGSYNLMENMLGYGYEGKIFPINPGAKEILGIKAYPNVRKVGEKIDLAIISLPRESVIRAIEECAESGVKSVIVVSQGFSDADDRGKALQQDMVAIARDNGLRILGPNTLGVVNNFDNFTTSFMPLDREKAPVGIICQSGLFFVGAKNFAGKIGKGIDIGNACDIGFCECLQYLGEDPDINVIAIHMESLDQGRQFLSLASHIAIKKPIIVFKTGRSETGARAVASHSGSMAGHYPVYKAALEQAGLIILNEDGQMKGAIRAFLHLPALKGSRIAVITITGAGGIVASDALEKYGLRMAHLSKKTIDSISVLSPEWMHLDNPMDIWPAVMKHGIQEVYGQALKAVLADPNVDGVLCISVALELPKFHIFDVSDFLPKCLEKETHSHKPVVVWLYGPSANKIAKKFDEGKRIMAYETIEMAAWSLSILRERQRFLHTTGSR